MEVLGLPAPWEMNQNNPSIVHPIPSDSISLLSHSETPTFRAIFDCNMVLENREMPLGFVTIPNDDSTTKRQKHTTKNCFKWFVSHLALLKRSYILVGSNLLNSSLLYFPDFFLMASSSPRHAPGFLPVAIANLRPLRFAPRVPNPRLKRCPGPHTGEVHRGKNGKAKWKMLILFKARISCFTWNYLNKIFENYLKDIYFNSKYLKIRNTNQHSNTHQKTHPNSCCFFVKPTELPGVPRNVEISNLRSLALENFHHKKTRDDCFCFSSLAL